MANLTTWIIGGGLVIFVIVIITAVFIAGAMLDIYEMVEKERWF